MGASCILVLWSFLGGENPLDSTVVKFLMATLLFAPCLLVGEETDSLAEALGVEQVPSDEVNEIDEAYQAAYEQWREGEQKLKDNFREELSKMIAMADEVQVLLLDFEMKRLSFEKIEEMQFDGKEDEFFYIDPYDSHSKILKSRKLKGDERKACVKAATTFINGEDLAGPLCHFPIHGIRFKRKGALIYETSICWHCSNYFVRYPGSESARWAGFKDEQFKAFLDKVMPIPQSELDRFEKWSKGDK